MHAKSFQRIGWIRVLAAAGFIASATGVVAQSEITWYVFNLPPLYILDGDRKGAGIVDLALQRQLIPALTEYRHKVVEAPLRRLEVMLKTEPNTCALGLLKNAEREQNMLFSVPFLAQIPPGVFVRRSDNARIAPYVDGDGRINLTKLLANGVLTVGVSNARSYGATVDELLGPYKGKPNVFVNAASNPAKSLLQMELASRVDVVPGFPYEASYLGVETGFVNTAIRFYPLAEQPVSILGHAVCAKGPFGAAAIRHIDAVLNRRKVRDAITGYYESWLDEESRALSQRLRRHMAATASPPESLVP